MSMKTKTGVEYTVTHDPLNYEGVDELLKALDDDTKSCLKYMTSKATDYDESDKFDMFDEDNWDIHSYAIDDIKNSINALRNEINQLESDLRKSNASIEGNKRGIKFWMDKYNKEIEGSHLVNHWKNKSLSIEKSMGDQIKSLKRRLAV